MTDTEFWNHIAALNATGANPDKPEPYRRKLVAYLDKLSAAEIGWFQHRVAYQLSKLRTRRLWCAATLVGGGYCGNEHFEDFRAWVVAQGVDVFSAVLANPDHLARLTLPVDKEGNTTPLLKQLLWTPRKIFDKKIGNNDALHEQIWDALQEEPDFKSADLDDFHIGWSYWDPVTADELQREFPALWAQHAKSYLSYEADEDDNDLAGFVKHADIAGLGTVKIGDILIGRHDGDSFTVLGINDSSVVFGGEYIGGEDFRYMARVRDADGEIRSNQGLSGRYQRRPGDPDTGPPVDDDDDDSGSGVSEASMELDDAIQARVKAALGDDVRVIYEAYEFDDDDLPVDNLDKRAHKGKIRFVAEDLSDGEQFESEVLENPTWMDIARVANQMLLALGDRDHIYLEGFDIVKKPKGEPVIAEFSMGS